MTVWQHYLGHDAAAIRASASAKKIGKRGETAQQPVPGTGKSEKYIDIDDIFFNPFSKLFSLSNVNMAVGSCLDG